MTLDPVHLDGIADLARRISREADESDHRAVAETVWENFFDPLYADGDPVLEPLDDHQRYAAPIDELALQDAPFEPVHGLDSGTINPRTFKNGLVLDVAQAAMSATPSNLDLHRSRTIITSVHSNDARVDHGTDWTTFDDDYGRGRIVHVPRLARDQERVVHGISLYLSESTHALRHADAVSTFLYLDGPLYPKGMVNWLARHTGVEDLLTGEGLVREVLENYVGVVDRFAAQGAPVVGFVKNASSQALLRALRDRDSPPPTPWANDLSLFAQLLERRERVDGSFRRRTDQLSWTNWFVSRLGADAAFSSYTEDLGVERALDDEAYEVAFFVVYDPRTDLAYKVELPRVFAADDEVRERVRTQVLRDVAGAAGPPPAIGKADELARIGEAEKASLVEKLEVEFDSERVRTYDDERWGA